MFSVRILQSVRTTGAGHGNRGLSLGLAIACRLQFGLLGTFSYTGQRGLSNLI